ncbi:glutathione S-transferase N-terminal domain-containing protein [Paremcibacter congregatus]|uniref:GST N-terminal domain-containing protein n=1 Tax=Paremcibacter congregatus TaxID=2043170 RepID=A0A2G4YRV8_9PROT|nr:glutathione S-transferase N-terminal domain-containing protein [Paremcibacter congregatus]PHZ85051.1 hypothetical protein CRD36_10065 [Paremcibacter congregatus]QDE25973.1 hypothetical protein FIV45_01085 [Paremcibacter congregatus]
MELFYTLTSPYSRKILLVLDHLKLTDQVTLTFLHPFEDQSGRLIEANPLGKIPTLVLGRGYTVYDSPVIADALFQMAETPELSFEEHLKQQKMQALADGIMDAAVLAQQEKCRDAAQQSPMWLERWEAAILRGLQEFEHNMIHDAGDWHIGSMSMACALDYIRFRHPDLNWMTDHPLTYKWYQTVQKMDIMIKTDPRQT